MKYVNPARHAPRAQHLPSSEGSASRRPRIYRNPPDFTKFSGAALAFALGAGSIAFFAVWKLAIRSMQIQRLKVDRLEVGELKIAERSPFGMKEEGGLLRFNFTGFEGE